jgi:putative hydrolase of the HAD superfamily
MEKQTILFDLDDTLVFCNKYFIMTINRFADQMETWFSLYGISRKEFKQKQLEIDLAGVHIHGFQVERFPQSLIETYEYFSKQTGRSTQKNEMDKLLEIGRSVYDQAVEPYPYMMETLQVLNDEGHELYLYTGGDASVQHKKVQQVGLEQFFGKRIFVTEHKTRSFLDSIMKVQKFDRNKTWMIGNSARTDVVPALEVGIHSIYIPADQEWEYNVVDINIKPRGAFFTLSSLQEVPSAIRNYTKASKTG